MDQAATKYVQNHANYIDLEASQVRYRVMSFVSLYRDRIFRSIQQRREDVFATSAAEIRMDPIVCCAAATAVENSDDFAKVQSPFFL
ncbi:hypothetical protein NKH10_29045 [Mesorhizobium sp. M1340]|uniref:hypothetical protein n=1 Tax=unclassified Mesorhizobium TaxID=325217 RepID=UPI0033359829